MYFLPVLSPIYIQGDRKFVHSEWKRALLLLRDSLQSRYGDFVVAAPWLPAENQQGGEQVLEELGPADGFELQPTFDWRIRARDFWLHEVSRVRTGLEETLARASVVHAGFDDLYRPIIDIAFMSAVQRGLPTILVQDTDIVTQTRHLPEKTLLARTESAAYRVAYQQIGRYMVAHADLSLLKGKELMTRYARFAKNAREFHNTSYMSSEIAIESAIERRLGSLSAPRPLKLVYCGRLVARKGVADAIRIVAQARAKGARVTLDIIGQGPVEGDLRDQIAAGGLGEAISLDGTRPYGAALLQELSGYDALLFTPTAEDTPRMIFDGYAAGLPLLGVGIPYVCERAEEEGAAIVLPRGDVERSAEALLAVDRDRSCLAPLARRALSAARYHAADNWYKRRAEWTHAAIQERANGRSEFARGGRASIRGLRS